MPEISLGARKFSPVSGTLRHVNVTSPKPCDLKKSASVFSRRELSVGAFLCFIFLSSENNIKMILKKGDFGGRGCGLQLSVKSAVFWDGTPRSQIYVSEEPTVSNCRVEA